jgi:hypothetical protein
MSKSKHKWNSNLNTKQRNTKHSKWRPRLKLTPCRCNLISYSARYLKAFKLHGDSLGGGGGGGEKSNDVVQIGYGNINGILGKVIGNTKVPAVRRWI